MKRILTVILIVNFTHYVAAQDKTKRLYIGPEISLNVASLKDRSDNFERKQGAGYKNYVRPSLGLGINTEYFVNSIVSLQTGLLYMPKGGGFRKENPSVFYLGGQGDEKAYYYRYYQLNYLEVPALFKVTFNAAKFEDNTSEMPRIQMLLGPAFSFNTRSRIRENEFHTGSGTGLVSVNESWNVREYDHAKNTISNFVFGFELQFATDSERLVSVSLRRVGSLGSVYEQAGYGNNDRVTNRTYSLAAGLKF